ncbi:MAG: hypothetical protein ABJG75_01200 [Roseobacter sp.]
MNNLELLRSESLSLLHFFAGCPDFKAHPKDQFPDFEGVSGFMLAHHIKGSLLTCA